MTAPATWRNRESHYTLAGNECTQCQERFFPSRNVCRGCGASALKPFSFAGTGSIATYTVIRTPSVDPEKENIDIPARETPYILAIIALDEGPRLTAELVECGVADIAIGKRVAAVFRKITERGKKGVIHYGYKFRLTGPAETHN